MHACESPFDSSQAQEHSSLGVRVPYVQGPPPAWLPTPDSIADTNLAALMRDFQVRGEQVFPNRLGCIPFVCLVACRLSCPVRAQGFRQGLVPKAQALNPCARGAAPEVLWAQQHDNVRAGSVFPASDLQALLKLGG